MRPPPRGPVTWGSSNLPDPASAAALLHGEATIASLRREIDTLQRDIQGLRSIINELIATVDDLLKRRRAP